jgi:ABC-type uncharacterized transport system fused permease/ATPase subunit
MRSKINEILALGKFDTLISKFFNLERNLQSAEEKTKTWFFFIFIFCISSFASKIKIRNITIVCHFSKQTHRIFQQVIARPRLKLKGAFLSIEKCEMSATSLKGAFFFFFFSFFFSALQPATLVHVHHAL